jgi:hypothetical protein
LYGLAATWKPNARLASRSDMTYTSRVRSAARVGTAD